MRKKRQVKKSNWDSKRLIFWGLLGSGVLLLAAMLSLVLPKAALKDSGTPKLVVEPARLDYGDVKYDTPLNFELKVTNQGDGILRFKSEPVVEVREGC